MAANPTEILSSVRSLPRLIEILSAIRSLSPKFVIDIESSGKTWEDHLFLIGYTYNTRDGRIIKGFIAYNPLSETEMRMLKEGMLDWIDLWMRKGW